MPAVASALLLLASAAAAQPGIPAPSIPDLVPPETSLDGRTIAQRAQDTLRGDLIYIEATMTIESPRLPVPREVSFRAWDDRRQERSFIRILAPAKDKGMGFLKIDNNLWNYIPRVERTVRIPPSMMQQSWMGSDFTNDDLVQESDEVEDYEHRILGVDPSVQSNGARAFVLQYLAREEAPVVWAMIIAWVETSRFTPLRQDFYDEDGERVRTLRFDDIRDVGDRAFPHRWSASPAGTEDRRTVVRIDKVEFDPSIDGSLFTTGNLRRH